MTQAWVGVPKEREAPDSASRSFNVSVREPIAPNAVGLPAEPPPAILRVVISLFSGVILYSLVALE